MKVILDSKEKIEEELKKQNLKREEYLKEYNIISKKLTTNWNKINKLKTALIPFEKKDEAWYLFEDGYVNGERYKLREEWINNNFPGLMHTGFWRETNQIAFTIIYRNNKKKDIISSIKKLISNLKSVKSEDKLEIIRFGMHDKELSSSGIYHFDIQNNKARVAKTTYGRFEVLKDFDTIENSFQFLIDQNILVNDY